MSNNLPVAAVGAPSVAFSVPENKNRNKRQKKIYEQHTLFAEDVIKDISEATQQFDFSLKIT